MSKKKEPTVVSPKGVASYCHLLKPDTGREYSDDKYKIDILLDKEGADNQGEINQFVEMINEQHENHRGKKKTESPVKDGDEEDNENHHGKWRIRFKSDFPPKLVDSKKNILPEGVSPYGGDVVKVAFAIHPYEKGKNAGVSLRLKAVMLVEKNNTGGLGAAAAFDEEEEGYSVDVSDNDADNDDF